MITGGAGFIGSCVIRRWLQATGWTLVCVDALSYAGTLASLEGCTDHPRFRFEQADVRDVSAMQGLLYAYRPQAILHLAAESHVDRSIRAAGDFIQTNIVGTFTLLEAARMYWQELPQERRADFRFHHVSTDEVFGSLEPGDSIGEEGAYRPNSPYSASKAAADHLVCAWHGTYGLPTLISRSANNFGPRQHPEKLIPLMVSSALAGQFLPLYGDGRQVRNWLHVNDHADALRLLLERGQPGQTYNVGGSAWRCNVDVVHGICAILDGIRPQHAPHRRLVQHVADRPGHDRRYAMDSSKMVREFGWEPKLDFDQALTETVRWYVDNEAWRRSFPVPA